MEPNEPRAAATRAVGVHRRLRVRSRGKASRRSRTAAPYVLLVVGASLLIGVTGFTFGSLVVGSFSSSPEQTSAYGVPTTPPGVSFVFAEAQLVSPTSAPATGNCTAPNLGTMASPTPLVDGAATGICLSSSAGGFSTGDLMFTMEVSWNASAANNTTFKVQVFVGVMPVSHDVVVTSYVNTTKVISTSEQAVYALDLPQASDTGYTSFAAIVTQL